MGAFADTKIKQVKIGGSKVTYVVLDRKMILFVLGTMVQN